MGYPSSRAPTIWYIDSVTIPKMNSSTHAAADSLSPLIATLLSAQAIPLASNGVFELTSRRKLVADDLQKLAASTKDELREAWGQRCPQEPHGRRSEDESVHKRFLGSGTSPDEEIKLVNEIPSVSRPSGSIKISPSNLEGIVRPMTQSPESPSRNQLDVRRRSTSHCPPGSPSTTKRMGAIPLPPQQGKSVKILGETGLEEFLKVRWPQPILFVDRSELNRMRLMEIGNHLKPTAPIDRRMDMDHTFATIPNIPRVHLQSGDARLALTQKAESVGRLLTVFASFIHRSFSGEERKSTRERNDGLGFDSFRARNKVAQHGSFLEPGVHDPRRHILDLVAFGKRSCRTERGETLCRIRIARPACGGAEV